MPNSFVGLLLFVVALAPGAAFLAIHHRGPYAARSASALHELSTVVLASLVFNAATLVLIRLIGPLAGPIALDIDELAVSPRAYLRSSYDLAAMWLSVLLLVSVGLAVVGAGLLNRRGVHEYIRDSAIAKWLLPNSTRTLSGWTKLLRETKPDKYKQVTCHFNDGSRMVGWIKSFNTEVADTADRDIVLSAPLTYWPKDGGEEEIDYGAVAISARSLSFVQVEYWDSLPDPRSEGAGADPDGIKWSSSARRAMATLIRWRFIRSSGDG